MPPEVLSAANGLGFIHLCRGCWVSALDGSIWDAGYTSTNKAYTVSHSERSRHYSNINTWTIAVGSSVPKDWPSGLRMFNEIWPSQRGQAWLPWTGETWTVQSTPRGGTIRGPALSWLLPPSEGQLCPLQWCVYHGSLWGGGGGKRVRLKAWVSRTTQKPNLPSLRALFSLVCPDSCLLGNQCTCLRQS